MNLQKIRNEHKITQENLANRVGVTRQMISAIEKGAKPSVETAKKIAEILDFEWTKFFE